MFDGLKRFLGVATKEDELHVEERNFADADGNGWYIVYPDGQPYAGPYKRESDAKGQLTRMRRSYTPAARRFRD